MSQYEQDYCNLVCKVLLRGEERETRNGITKAIFPSSLTVSLADDIFPILQARKMFYKGVLGEFAAFIRGPKSLADFEKWGCNYWGPWADPDGSLRLDYGNAWLEHGQLERLIRTLKTNPYDRRLLVTGWRPENLHNLSLPCCHHTYQFYADTYGKLHMLWMQRSVDLMIGLPSDVILAAAWLIALAREVDLLPGTITFSLGDTHIYEEHLKAAELYVRRVNSVEFEPPTYHYTGRRFFDFEPDQLGVDYAHFGAIKMEVKP